MHLLTHSQPCAVDLMRKCKRIRPLSSNSGTLRSGVRCPAAPLAHQYFCFYLLGRQQTCRKRLHSPSELNQYPIIGLQREMASREERGIISYVSWRRRSIHVSFLRWSSRWNSWKCWLWRIWRTQKQQQREKIKLLNNLMKEKSMQHISMIFMGVFSFFF